MEMKLRIFRYLSFGVLLYGIVFSFAYFTPSFKFNALDLPQTHFVSYVSLTSGMFLMLCGLMLLLLVKRLNTHPFLLFPLRVVSTFLCLDGLISLYFFTLNPFAWILFLLSAGIFALSLWQTK